MDHLTGSVRFGIDPYDYRESYSRYRGMPRLDYDWRITGLWRNARESERPTHMSVLDERYVAVDRTGADGGAGYLLQVAMLGG